MNSEGDSLEVDNKTIFEYSTTNNNNNNTEETAGACNLNRLTGLSVR